MVLNKIAFFPLQVLSLQAALAVAALHVGWFLSTVSLSSSSCSFYERFLYYASVSIPSLVFWLLEELLHQLRWRSWRAVCFDSNVAMRVFFFLNLLKSIKIPQYAFGHICHIVWMCSSRGSTAQFQNVQWNCRTTSCKCKNGVLYFQLAYLVIFLFSLCNFKANRNCKCYSTIRQLFPLEHLRRSSQRPRHKGANLQYYFTLFTSTHLWLMGVTRANNQLISFGCVWAQCGQFACYWQPLWAR